MKLIQCSMPSKIGPVYLTATEKGLRGVFLKKQNAPLVRSLKGSSPAVRILRKTVHQLEEYLSGKRKRFVLPLDAAGTAFQKSVWEQLKKIPYGKTCSYKDIARKIRNAKAVRAVGSANGKNPLCIIVPCHRVIAVDGNIGGYSGGIAIKKKLLKLELSGAF